MTSDLGGSDLEWVLLYKTESFVYGRDDVHSVYGVEIRVKVDKEKTGLGLNVRYDLDHPAIQSCGVGSLYAGKIETDINALYAAADPAVKARAEGVRRAFETAFRDAGFDLIFMEEIPNEYYSIQGVVPYHLTSPWFLCTTKIGHVKIGRRKSVIVLDWSRTTLKASPADIPVMAPAVQNGVTTGDRMIHVYGYELLTAYLKGLHECAG